MGNRLTFSALGHFESCKWMTVWLLVPSDRWLHTFISKGTVRQPRGDFETAPKLHSRMKEIATVQVPAKKSSVIGKLWRNTWRCLMAQCADCCPLSRMSLEVNRDSINAHQILKRWCHGFTKLPWVGQGAKEKKIRWPPWLRHLLI